MYFIWTSYLNAPMSCVSVFAGVISILNVHKSLLLSVGDVILDTWVIPPFKALVLDIIAAAYKFFLTVKATSVILNNLSNSISILKNPVSPRVI